MKRDCLVEIADRGRTYFEFVSKNGIVYELHHGVTIGRGTFVSETLFIMLTVIYEDLDKEDEFIMLFGENRRVVDFFQCCWTTDVNNKDCKRDAEKDIRRSVDAFESNHKEMIEFINRNGMKTLG